MTIDIAKIYRATIIKRVAFSFLPEFLFQR